MTEMIENRKGEKKHDRIDLFSILLDAHESGETEFTKEELLGNMFMFLVAGHEVSLFSSSSIKYIKLPVVLIDYESQFMLRFCFARSVPGCSGADVRALQECLAKGPRTSKFFRLDASQS
jgi:hypothetical protein